MNRFLIKLCIMAMAVAWLAATPSTGKAAQRMLSRSECAADIDSLVYTLVETHPNIYSRIGISDFMGYVEDAKHNLSDSLSVPDLYQRIAPLVAMIGDAHTAMNPPGEEILELSPMMLPFMVHINDSGTDITVAQSATIPTGSRVLSVNKVPAQEILAWMLGYISGEQDFYRYTRMSDYFPWLFQLRYGSDSYTVEYQAPGSVNTAVKNLAGISYDDFAGMIYSSDFQSHETPYYYNVPEGADYAVMTFGKCADKEAMGAFADSLVADLRHEGIHKLIIDIRANTGGDSSVGDTLLRRLASVPFTQYEEVYCRITPTIEKLIGEPIGNNVFYYKASEADYEPPLPAGRRFSGECVLLTSHKTFSSASSFARAFKHFGVGKVVGEETGGLDIHFGDILPYTLPNSGLLTLISFKRFRLPGADESAPSGTVPDIAVPAAEALDAAIRFLQSTPDKSRP